MPGFFLITAGAGIIAVADFFEAITAKRHYRNPMHLNNAFQLIKDESGKLISISRVTNSVKPKNQ